MMEEEDFEPTGLTGFPEKYPEAIPGTPLAEIFSVKIDTYGKKCKIYGTIKVTDDKGTLYLYEVRPFFAESIDKSGFLHLTNRDRAISACNQFTVHLDLMENNIYGDDVEFIKGSFTWSEQDDGYYDHNFVFKNVAGKAGLAIVCYTVHSVALEAVLLVEHLDEARYLLESERSCMVKKHGVDDNSESGETDDDDSDTSDKEDTDDDVSIYGTITLTYKKRFNLNNKDKEEHYRIVIFDEPFDEPVAIMHKGILPLARSVVSVPSYSSISLEVNLSVIDNGKVRHLVWSHRNPIEFKPMSVINWFKVEKIKESDENGKWLLRLSATWFNYYVYEWESSRAAKERCLRCGMGLA